MGRRATVIDVRHILQPMLFWRKWNGIWIQDVHCIHIISIPAVILLLPCWRGKLIWLELYDVIAHAGLSPSITTAKLKTGETVAAQNKDRILVQIWQDRREMLMLSTKHIYSMVEVPGKSINKPEIILFYNKSKHGIDISEQLASYHTSIRRIIRWYHKVAMELLLGTCKCSSFFTTS